MYATPYYQPYWLNDDELEHYGALGMKWGVRRYMNKDGTLTPAGKSVIKMRHRSKLRRPNDGKRKLRKSQRAPLSLL